MAQVIKLKRGTTNPTTGNIADGEVAINKSNKTLHMNDGGTIKQIGGTPGIDDQATGTAITVTSAGDVGINDTNPSAKLDVNGDVKADQYYISTAFIDQTAGDFGSVNVTGALGAGGNSYSGWAVNDRVVLMNNGGSTSGLYNDTNIGWFGKCSENAAVSLYNAGAERLTTTSYGVSGVWSNNGTPNLSSQIRKLTQAQYDAIGTKDANTLYIIVG